MASNIATIRPSDFVRSLVDPGIDIGGNRFIPLQQYMSAAPEYRGNKNCEDILSPLQRMRYPTGDRVIDRTKRYGRLMMGQGFPGDFKIVMQYIADNLDAIRNLQTHDWSAALNPNPTNRHDRWVYTSTNRQSAAQRYFTEPADAVSVLNRMVANKVFGLDCIGFVSQYLIAAGVWDDYKSYYPHNYLDEFTPVSSLRQIERLCVLVWGRVHVAIIDEVEAFLPNEENPTSVRITVCQSSGGREPGQPGPQINRRVELRSHGRDTTGRTKFRISNVGTPAMPVAGDVYVGKKTQSGRALAWIRDVADNNRARAFVDRYDPDLDDLGLQR